MARILAYTTPSRGHLFPLTPILDELHRRGHTISVRTLASQVLLMRSRGFDAAPISTKIEEIETRRLERQESPAGAGRRCGRILRPSGVRRRRPA